MTGEGFGAAHFGTRITDEDRLERVQLGDVARRRRGGMGVDVIDGADIEARVLQCILSRSS